MLVGAFLVANWDSMGAVGAEVGAYARRLGDALLLAVYLTIAGAAVIVVFALWQRYSERDRQRDGSHKVRTYKVRTR